MASKSQAKVTGEGEKTQIGSAGIFQREEQMGGKGKRGGKSGHQNLSPLPSLGLKRSSRPVLTGLVATSHVLLLSFGHLACH